MRSLASGLRESGRSNSAEMTLFKVFFTPWVSNGGCPTNNVYNMQPTDHTSASKPWALRLATSLQIVCHNVKIIS